MAKLLKNSDAKLKGLMIHSMLASYRIRSLAIYVVMIKRGVSRWILLIKRSILGI